VNEDFIMLQAKDWRHHCFTKILNGLAKGRNEKKSKNIARSTQIISNQSKKKTDADVKERIFYGHVQKLASFLDVINAGA